MRRSARPGAAAQAGDGTPRQARLDLGEPAARRPFSTKGPIPDGFAYRAGLIPPDQEDALIGAIRELPFKPFAFHGHLGNRRVVSFGLRYDYAGGELRPASDIPAFLLPLRELAAALAGVPAAALIHALVTEYAPGAGIGWHRDRPVFDLVVGISLLAPCRLRLRRKVGTGWQRAAVLLEPRSAYLLRGAVRWAWQHSIAPMEVTRYSITFRSLKDPGGE
jgi:alkylated DNA repair dioxygenase AlkB